MQVQILRESQVGTEVQALLQQPKSQWALFLRRKLSFFIQYQKTSQCKTWIKQICTILQKQYKKLERLSIPTVAITWSGQLNLIWCGKGWKSFKKQRVPDIKYYTFESLTRIMKYTQLKYSAATNDKDWTRHRSNEIRILDSNGKTICAIAPTQKKKRRVISFPRHTTSQQKSHHHL